MKNMCSFSDNPLQQGEFIDGKGAREKNEQGERQTDLEETFLPANAFC